MKAANSNEIKNELKELSASRLVDICLRLVRFKKENKELITYLLFEANDLQLYITNIKLEMEGSFAQINTSNNYFVKKSLRKILRSANKYIKYTSSKQAEAELLLYFCAQMKQNKIKIQNSNALINLYNGQIKKIELALATLHEDLQYDYLPLLQNIKNNYP